MSVDRKPFGYEWRSSRVLIVSSITIALFSDTFLYGFLVPILSYMLEDRLHIAPSQTQNLTTTLFTVQGLFTLISAPIVAHFADKLPNRKTPLLIALAGCFAGTLLIALTPSLWLFFVGRIIQAIAGSAAWVIGFGLLVDSIGKQNVGKMIGIAMSFVTAGVVGGPTVSGILLELAGYWPAWSVPLGVLILDIIARLLTIEPQDAQVTPSTDTNTDSSTPEETTGLLPPASNANANANADKKSFYRIMLRDLRVLTGLANAVVNSSIMAGFNTTLPIHLREAFGWGSMPTSMMFFCLRLPSIFFSGLLGPLWDKFRLRIPTMIGWMFSAPLLWLLGMCGDERFPWASADAAGKP